LATPRVAILIAAYNEEKTISEVVLGASNFGQVFVSDDGSTDATAEAALRSGAVVLSQGSNQGYDSALAFGLSKLSREEFDFVITMDADGQHDFGDILLFEGALTAGAFLVVGTRPRKARLMEKVFGFFTTVIWGVPDPLCGMKGYRISLLRDKRKIKTYDSVGTEILMFALNNGLRVDCVPISGKERDGKPRFAGVVRANLVIGLSLTLAFLIALKSFALGSSGSQQK
jgi:glycosyltransferase involved in cell wall biosynthesis